MCDCVETTVAIDTIDILKCLYGCVDDGLRRAALLPIDEREVLRSAIEMLAAAKGKIDRRITAHSNALEVQS